MSGRAGIAWAALLMCFAGNARAVMTISPSTVPDWTVNIAYSQALTGSDCTLGLCTWSVSGNVPPGLMLGSGLVSGSAVISGTPITSGTYTFTVTATIAALLDSGSQSYTVTINPAPSITTGTLNAGTVGAAYSQPMTGSGGTGGLTWTASGLPANLTINSSSGLISGTPQTAGSFNVTVTATDSVGGTSGAQPYTLTINPAPMPTLTPTSTSLNFGTYTLGGTAPAAGSISVTSTNPSSGMAFTVSQGSDCAWLTVPASGTTPATLTASVNTAANVSAATHNCVLTFSATGVSPSPTLTATATAATTSATPALMPTSTSLNFGTYTLGGTAPAAGSISVTSTNPSSGMAFTVSQGSDCAWLTVPASGTTPATLTASVNTAANVSAATHNCVLTFSATGVSPSPTLTATATAATTSATPTLTPTSTSLNFGTYTFGGTAPAAGSISVTSTNPSSGMAFTVSQGSDCAWLIVPASGTTPATLTASVNTAANVSAATHNCVLTFSATGVSPSPTLTATATAASQAPTLTLNGVPASATSAQQIAFTLTLSSGYVSQVTGQVTLAFQPDAVVSADDPAIQFSSGSRTAAFTIPANSTNAQFATNPVAFQTGTTAGTITLTVTSDLPGGNLTQTVTVARAAPAIQSTSVTQSASGFQVQVTGFSNSRELAGASFHFTAVTGQTVQTSDLSVSLSTLASQWFSSASSNPFGGQFLLVVPFTIQQGAASGLASVSVKLQNALNTSAAVTANF